MHLRILIAATLAPVFVTPATAQQQVPDPVFLQEVIAVMQRHREYNANALVSAETNAALLARANAALRDKIAELEKELAALKAKPAAPSPPVPDPVKPVDPAPAK